MKKFLLFFVLYIPVLTSFSQESRIETILQRGHSRPVNALSISNDGKFLLTGSLDNSIILWNISSGKQIRTYNRHTETVSGIEFHPSGKLFLSVSQDQTVCLIEVESGKLIHRLRIEKGEMYEAHFSPTGKYIYILDKRDGVHVFGSYDGNFIRKTEKNYGAFGLTHLIDPLEQSILSCSDYKQVVRLNIVTGDTLSKYTFDKPYGMGFGAEGKSVVITSAKLFGTVFEAKTGKPTAELLPDHKEMCDGCNTYMAIAKKGDLVFTKDSKGKGNLWQLPSGKKLRSFCDRQDRPSALQFSPDDQIIAVAFDRELELYNTGSGQLIKTISCEFLRYGEFSLGAGAQLALPAKFNAAEVYDARTGSRKKTIAGFLNSGKGDGLRFDPSYWRDQTILRYIAMKRSFALSPDERYLAFGNIDSSAFVMELATGRIIHRLQGHSGVVYALDFSPDGKSIATAGGDRMVCVWDAATGKIIRKLKGHKEVVFSLKYSNDGNWIVSGSWDATLRMWDLKSNKHRVIDLGNVSPYTVAFSPRDLYVLTGDLGEEIHFWEVDAGQKFRSLIGHTGLVSAFDFSADGKLLVTGSWDGKVKVWDVLTGMQLFKQEAHEGPVMAACFDPQGKYVASGGSGQAILIWDQNSGKIIHRFEGHTSPVTHLSFFEGGNKLLSFGEDGSIRIWDLKKGKELYSRVQINRNEWIATTPSGRFDGSERSLQLVNYVSGMDVVPVGSLFEKYYTPGLIDRLNKGEDLGSADNKMQESIASTPSLKLQINQTQSRGESLREDTVYRWTTEKFPLTIQVDPNGNPVEEIRVYNNGKLIAAEKYGETIQFRGGGKEIRHLDIALQDGTNKITAVVVNAQRSESAPVEVMVEYNGQSAGTDLFLFTIGIDQYKNKQYDLKFAAGDAQAFATSLKSGGKSLFQSVKEFSLRNKEATRENVLNTFSQIRKEIGPEDVLVFYYAGHGTMSVERDAAKAEFFLVLHEVINLYDAREQLAVKAFAAGELRDWSMKISAQKQLFILDACHSGGAVDQLASRGDGREKAIAQLARSTGTFFLTASQDAQFANESGQLNHGLFTYALLEVLQGKTTDADGKIMVNELRIHAEERVPELSEKLRGSAQYPVSYSFGQDFPVVMLR